MKKTIIILILVIITVSCKNDAQQYIEQIEEKNNTIDDLNNKIIDLEKELDNRKSQESDNNDYTLKIDDLNEKKIALLEEELAFDKNRVLTKVVFLGMIADSDFKNNIESVTYRNTDKPLLTKVSVRIEGTENIMKFYSLLYSDYHWLYMTNNIK